MKNNQLFVTVGTIEPRKGHEEILKVFNLLWVKGKRSNRFYRKNRMGRREINKRNSK